MERKPCSLTSSTDILFQVYHHWSTKMHGIAVSWCQTQVGLWVIPFSSSPGTNQQGENNLEGSWH